MHPIISWGWILAALSMPWKYALEARPEATFLLDEFFHPLAEGRWRAVTSLITIIEVLTKPYSLGAEDVVDRYLLALFDCPNLEIKDINLPVAIRAAQLRGQEKLRTPDAIQVATALEAGATVFLTNDRGIPRYVHGLEVLYLADYTAGG